MAPQVHHRSCNLCEAMCGLRIEHDGERIVSIQGDDDDPLSAGHICPKAVALRDIADDPDRLRTPIRRNGDSWQAIGWREALDEVANRLGEVAERHGRDAVAVYQGNPSVHNLGTMLMAPHLVRALGTKNRYSATSVDQLPHHLVSYHLFGHQLLLPVPDVDRTQHMLILGANPLVSNGSLMSAPGMRRRLKALQARGGRVVVVDPRRTETAARADAHHFIRPGSDALLLAAMLQRIFATVGPRPGRLAAFTDGVDALQAAIAGFSPERVAPAVGIDAATIAAMADAFAAAESAVCYTRMGVSTAPFGATATWLGVALNIVTGNFDRPGGLMFTSPAVDAVAATSRGGHGRWRSRVRQLAEFGGELPVATLAEEIETPGPGQVRALLTSAGNPVLSTPDGKRLGAALQTLAFMASIDIYRNETTRFAHLILPPRTGLEVPHYDLVFHTLAVRNTARFADPLLPGAPDARFDWQIYAELTRRLQARRRANGKGPGLGKRLQQAAILALPPTQQLDIALRRGPYGAWGGRAMRSDGLSIAALRAAPHGVDLGPLQPRLPERLFHRDKRIALAPAVLLADLTRLQASIDGAPGADGDAGYDLQLIGRRQLADSNSWMHNAKTLMGGRPRCTLLMHPGDAEARGLAAGSMVRLRSSVGAVEVPLELSAAMMPGVVSLPHGWGHGAPGTAQQLAAQHAGASINDVTDPQRIDALSGNAAFSGQPVRVESAAGPQ